MGHRRVNARYGDVISKYMYLKIKLTATGRSDFDMIEVKELILHLIGERFGEVGRGLPVDLLSYDERSREGILRCGEETFTRLSSSLLFWADFHGATCHFDILQTSSTSIGLVSNSRTYSHGGLENSNEVLAKKRKLK